MKALSGDIHFNSRIVIPIRLWANSENVIYNAVHSLFPDVQRDQEWDDFFVRAATPVEKEYDIARLSTGDPNTFVWAKIEANTVTVQIVDREELFRTNESLWLSETLRLGDVITNDYVAFRPLGSLNSIKEWLRSVGISVSFLGFRLTRPRALNNTYLMFKKLPKRDFPNIRKMTIGIYLQNGDGDYYFAKAYQIRTNLFGKIVIVDPQYNRNPLIGLITNDLSICEDFVAF